LRNRADYDDDVDGPEAGAVEAIARATDVLKLLATF